MAHPLCTANILKVRQVSVAMDARLCSSTSRARWLAKKPTKCGSICGDGVLADGEECYEISNGVLPYKVQRQATLQRIQSARVIACLRCSSQQLALGAARAALDAGIAVLEVTMTTPSASQVIEILVREYPSAVIGAGTVLSMQDAIDATRAKAKFLASPIFVKEIVLSHKDGPVVVLPGVGTLTEVANAYHCGAPAVKVFPVSHLGGVQYLGSLSHSLPHIPMVVSQGCTLDMVDLYIAAGSKAVILSDAIFDKHALEIRDFDRIKALALVAASKGA